MDKLIPAILVTAALTLGLTMGPLQTSGQPDRSAVNTLEQTVQDQGERLAAAERELATLRTQTEALSAACGELGGALASSRQNGFEYAGANPLAKTDLLEGLMHFSAQVGKATRPDGKTEDD